MASDGGAKQGGGSLGWTIGDTQANVLAKGRGPVAGFIPSSYRCELRGLYTALLFLIEFGRYMSNESDYTIQNAVEFLFYTDSESMINKLEFLDSYPSAQRRVVLNSD